VKPRVSALAAGLLIGGMFLLKLNVVLAAGLFFAAVLWFGLVRRRLSMDKVGFLVVLNYLYWIVSGFLVGALVLGTLASPGFYTGEGRIFIYYVPLLLFSVYAAKRRDISFVTRFQAWIALATLPLFAIWAVTGALGGGRANNFFGLLTSHTGAGTFYATLLLFLVICGLESKRRPLTLLGVAMILPVFGSASREAIAGLLVAIGWYVWRNLKARTLVYMVLIVAIGIGSLPFVAPHTYTRTVSVLSPETVTAIEQVVETVEWEPGRDTGLGEERYNILLRFLYWKYSVKMFLESPLVGIGFGRWNDHDVYVERVGDDLVGLGLSGKRVTEVHHAHNSYLHVLAETGLLGLALLMWLWITLLRRVQRAIAGHAGSRDVAAYLKASEGLIVFALVAALFGHALAAPSLGIPALTVIGIGISYDRVPIKPVQLTPGAPEESAAGDRAA
jgi:O-antigen ligase